MRPHRVGTAALMTRLASCLAAGIAPAAAQGTAPTWRGLYRYSQDGGGSAGAATYELSVVPGAARGGCLLSSRGSRHDGTIVCHATGDAGRLVVTFHGYADGRTVERDGAARYTLGDTLLTLTRTEVGGKLLTDWAAFRPDLPGDAPDPGTYLEPAP